MTNVSSERRHLVVRVKRTLRKVNNQVSLLSHRVSAAVEIKDIDLDTLDYLSQHGPKTASGLARGVGLHPATMTGVLDRLEKGGWIVRTRDADDRRSVLISIEPARNADMVKLYAGMDSEMDEVVASFSDSELGVIADFLERTAAAGARSTEQFDSEA
jgi:DNA-binding MarR family transcriptional regulator